jgi:Protein of unknown function (DUF1553)/Protein of unknown function (DUF1549)/Concanavalin A-like lectin/glucanases superfamily/Planctomycete cytochrome C
VRIDPIFAWTLLVAVGSVIAPAAAGESPDYERDVSPILKKRCLECHSKSKPRGGLDLSSRDSTLKGGEGGPSIVPGKPDDSFVWIYIDQGTMPPKNILPKDEKKILFDWIAAGALWNKEAGDASNPAPKTKAGGDWWSLQPVRRPIMSRVKNVAWAFNPIDTFVLHRLEAQGWSPAAAADRRTLLRRLAFDLTGLPPTPEEIDAFVKDDRPEAYDEWVDRYLASPQYGVRWARRWLDLARFGESNGFEHDEFRSNAWPYRDWVVDALNRDMPFDEFARLQLAGDVLKPDDPSAIEATGFLVAGAYDSVGQGQQSLAMRKVVREDELEDLVGTVAQTFLGLTVHCARCHDHKFDPISQVEYYRFAAALSGVRHGERELAPLDAHVKREKRQIDELAARLAAIEAPARERLRLSAESAGTSIPSPISQWDFVRDVQDHAGGLETSLHGGAVIEPDGLHVDGKTGYAATAPLARDLRAKTLEVWVRLQDLQQRGGAAIGVQSLDGQTFDAIVFGERESQRWMAGSEGFVRTQTFQGEPEAGVDRQLVALAITYAEDGTITAYRNGERYGKPYVAAPPVTFRAGQSHVVFGIRHGTPGGNRMLAGLIAKARVYDRALTADEVAASAQSIDDEKISAAIDQILDGELRSERARVRKELVKRRRSIATQTRKVYAVAPRRPEPTHRLKRGNTTQPAEVVSPGGLAAVVGLEPEFGVAPEASDRERRVRLASWVTNARNPLFARVVVNRLWQGHFGDGFVETPSDFGFNGGLPLHPELLDWLASELVARGWSLKAIHRLIVTSATYRQSSAINPAAAQVDASGRLLWRRAPQRLDAETVRDAMLAVSGALDLRLGGPGFREFAVSQAVGTITNQYKPVADDQDHVFDRRTLYRTWARGARNGFLDAFDCPDPSTTAPRRPVTTTPLQALALLNNALALRLADRFADRLRTEGGDDVDHQIDRAYRLAFSRTPDDVEKVLSRRVVQEHGLSALTRALFNSNEFLYVD